MSTQYPESEGLQCVPMSSDLEVVPQYKSYRRTEDIRQEKIPFNGYFVPDAAGLEPVVDQDRPRNVKEERICGVKRKTFWIILGILVFFIVAAAVGAGVGVAVGSKKNNPSTSAAIQPSQSSAVSNVSQTTDTSSSPTAGPSISQPTASPTSQTTSSSTSLPTTSVSSTSSQTSSSVSSTSSQTSSSSTSSAAGAQSTVCGTPGSCDLNGCAGLNDPNGGLGKSLDFAIRTTVMASITSVLEDLISDVVVSNMFLSVDHLAIYSKWVLKQGYLGMQNCLDGTSV
ncbi:hypothetical protein B0O99DRAFT_591159 [Bisporella sp. PMI_857]|nr:hypothetical protein B0O99DRAFT_591159 [Bisporella sp. PMI_857]